MSTASSKQSVIVGLVAGIVALGIFSAFVWPIMFEMIGSADVSNGSGAFLAMWGIFREVIYLCAILGLIGYVVHNSG